MGELLGVGGGGGGKGYVGPPLTLWGGLAPVPPPPPPSYAYGLVLVHVLICFYKTRIKLADCQILFYHTTRGLEWETVLCMIMAPSK